MADTINSAATRHIVCQGCGLSKPEDAFSARPKYRTGREGSCRVCVLERRRQRTAADPELQQRERERGREAARRRRAADPTAHRDQSRAHYYRNHDSIRESRRAARARNADRRRIANAEYRSRPEYAAERAERRRLQMQQNPEPIRARNRRSAARRRAAKAGVQQIPFTGVELAARLAFYGGRCWVCNEPGTHVDHVKPLAAGGPHILANLRPACQACNWKKNSRWGGVAWVIRARKLTQLNI